MFLAEVLSLHFSGSRWPPSLWEGMSGAPRFILHNLLGSWGPGWAHSGCWGVGKQACGEPLQLAEGTSLGHQVPGGVHHRPRLAEEALCPGWTGLGPSEKTALCSGGPVTSTAAQSLSFLTCPTGTVIPALPAFELVLEDS